MNPDRQQKQDRPRHDEQTGCATRHGGCRHHPEAEHHRAHDAPARHAQLGVQGLPLPRAQRAAPGRVARVGPDRVPTPRTRLGRRLRHGVRCGPLPAVWAGPLSRHQRVLVRWPRGDPATKGEQNHRCTQMHTDARRPDLCESVCICGSIPVRAPRALLRTPRRPPSPRPPWCTGRAGSASWSRHRGTAPGRRRTARIRHPRVTSWPPAAGVRPG